MEVLSKEDTLAAIAEATKPLLKELTILRKLVLENGERISTAEIRKLTGIYDIRTLQKRFTYLQKGTGKITWSKSEVLQWIAENELKAA